MVELRWEGDDKHQYLFAGCNETELAWLQKRDVRWSATVWLPGIDVGYQYNTLAAHRKNIMEKVDHWFGMAATSVPATDRNETDEATP